MAKMVKINKNKGYFKTSSIDGILGQRKETYWECGESHHKRLIGIHLSTGKKIRVGKFKFRTFPLKIN